MAQEYDKIFKENIEPLIPAFVRKLLSINPDNLEEIPGDLQYTIEQKTDFLKKVKQPDPSDDYALQIEFQATISPKMLKRLLIYYGFVFRDYDLPVRQYVFYIGHKKQAEMVTELSHPDLWFRYRLISLVNVDYELFIHSDQPEDVLIAILCDFKNESPALIIETILKRLKQLENDELELSRYARQLEVLSKLRKLQPLTIKKIAAMPIIYDLETDIRYLQGVEEEAKRQALQKRETVIKMIKDGKLSIKEISKYMNVTIKYILDIKQQLEDN